jgi:hypothetical protein
MLFAFSEVKRNKNDELKGKACNENPFLVCVRHAELVSASEIPNCVALSEAKRIKNDELKDLG